MLAVQTSTCVVPGRFQPFHNGHARLVDHAASQFDRVIVAISNAHISHTGKDPFTGGERYEMISSYASEVNLASRLEVVPIPVDDQPTSWVATIRAVCPAFSHVYTRNSWTESVFSFDGIPNSPTLLQGHHVTASEVRARMAASEDWASLVPTRVAEVLTLIDGPSRLRRLSASSNDRLGKSS